MYLIKEKINEKTNKNNKRKYRFSLYKIKNDLNKLKSFEKK